MVPTAKPPPPKTPVDAAPAWDHLDPGLLSSQLVAWFQGARRELPWRQERSAYRVWLSEVMLQQTQVSRVVGYFERFVARFPAVQDLAAADEDEVLSLWSGLGYYSRGRNLHKAAKAVVDNHGGVFPTTSEDLRTLPGVGEYTAAAVASFAGQHRVAVVDGNVVRVLSRLLNEDRAVQLPETRASLTRSATILVDAAADAALHNEAMMELGALVCTPRRVDCAGCPWRTACLARSAGTVSARPVKLKARARTHLRLACIVVDVGGRVYLERRGSTGLFGGLWEPITAVIGDGDDVEAVWNTLCVERGISPPLRFTSPIVVERTLTHRELRFEVTMVQASSAPSPPSPQVGVADAGVFDDDALLTIGLSSAVRAVLAAARSPRTPRLL